MSPSRDELLEIVRKYSSSLKESNKRDEGFWQEMLDMFFVRGLAESKIKSDDLLFFVNFQYLDNGLNEEGKMLTDPCFVRRWQPQLNKVIGDRGQEVDWRRSFYLNLIAHTTYTITVSICREDQLKRYKETPGVPLESIYKITKPVYASPSHSNFTKSSKASETIPSYPNIYFSIDDYDDTFENLILTDTEHCFCVLLHGTGGAAFGSGKTKQKDGSMRSKVTLFSGFVKYEIVRAAFESGKVSLGFLQLGGKSERLVMRGPGERGEVDVIVTRVIDGEQDELPSPMASEKAEKKTGIGSIVRKAAAAAKQAYLAASPDEIIPLRCSLMSVSLHWEHLAHDLLFKGT